MKLTSCTGRPLTLAPSRAGSVHRTRAAPDRANLLGGASPAWFCLAGSQCSPTATPLISSARPMGTGCRPVGRLSTEKELHTQTLDTVGLENLHWDARSAGGASYALEMLRLPPVGLTTAGLWRAQAAPLPRRTAFQPPSQQAGRLVRMGSQHISLAVAKLGCRGPTLSGAIKRQSDARACTATETENEPDSTTKSRMKRKQGSVAYYGHLESSVV